MKIILNEELVLILENNELIAFNKKTNDSMLIAKDNKFVLESLNISKELQDLKNSDNVEDLHEYQNRINNIFNTENEIRNLRTFFSELH
jgi:hypothetical protein